MTKSYCHIIPPIWTLRHPDMAAAWLTAYVGAAGFETRVLDLNVQLFHRETRPLVKDCWHRPNVALSAADHCTALKAQEGHVRARLEEVLRSGCRVFGMPLVDGTAHCVGWLSLLIKELCPEALVIVGGPGATSLYRLRRRYGAQPPTPHPVEGALGAGHAIDVWVLGEGEQTLLELLERHHAGHDLHGLRGAALTVDGPLAPFKERALIKDLSSLPLPSFEAFDLSRYSYRALPFQLSRGCAYARCASCAVQGYSRGFRVRSPDHALEELRRHVERYGVREFHFTDHGVNGDLAALEAFCDALIASGLEIRWQSFVQLRPEMDLPLLRKMVVSGCRRLNYGVESGSDVVLRAMRKPYTADDAARVLRLTREAGGEPIINLICGRPGETEEELHRTLDFLTENAPNISMVASVGFTGAHLHSPLLDEHQRFGVVLDGRGGWHSADGSIDSRERNERVHRVLTHLRRLGIPCFEAFWEMPSEEALSDPPLVHDHDPRWVKLTAVRVTSGGGTVSVRVGYRGHVSAKHVLFDLAITDCTGRLLFSTPEASALVRVIHSQSVGWLELVIARGELPEGRYVAWVRVRPLRSTRSYDRRCSSPFEVAAAPAPTPTLAPHTWTHYRGVMPEEES
jgi:hypothetical protein